MKIRRPLFPVLILLCLSILFAIRVLHFPLYGTQYQGQYDQVHTVTGVVESVQIKKDYAALQVDIGKEKVLLRLKNVSDESYLYDLIGRQVTARGLLTQPDGQRNPGSFNYQYYLAARKCYSILTCSKYKFIPGTIQNPLTHFIAFEKGLFFTKAKNMMSSTGFGITAGVLFGDKSYLDEDLYAEFQENGIAHVLAVSGLHIGLIYNLLNRLLQRKDKKRTVLTLLALSLYIILSNFSVSVLRASAMIALRLFAFHAKKRYDMFSAACLVAILTLLLSPYYLFDTGAQLSFLAAFSIAVLLPFFETKLKAYCDLHKNEKLYKYGYPILPGLALQIGMGPLMAYHFLLYAPFSLFINPLAIYLASLLLPIGLLAFVLAPIPLLMAAPCRIAEALVILLTKLSSLSNAIFNGFSIPAPPLQLLLLYYAFVFFFFSETRHILLRRKNEITLTLSCALLLLLCTFCPFAFGYTQSLLPWQYNRYDAVFLDVGQGDACHLQSKGVHLLVDGGGSFYKDIAKETLKPYFLKNGITTIDLAIVSHIDSDHSKGVADLSQIMKINTIAFPISAKDEDLSSFKADNIVFLDKGNQIQIGDALLTVLSASGKDSNSGSLVCQVDFPGESILFMGDAPMETEQRIAYKDIDILKVGHHGSKTSTSDYLLDGALPEIAIISCGKNNRYGHPTEEVLQKLNSRDITIRRTDQEGAICIR